MLGACVPKKAESIPHPIERCLGLISHCQTSAQMKCLGSLPQLGRGWCCSVTVISP